MKMEKDYKGSMYTDDKYEDNQERSSSDRFGNDTNTDVNITAPREPVMKQRRDKE